ncbi:MAG: isochorismatase family protein [Anaerolineaceae bacterium]|nr:isochorismatase family protein [Anaerolineaceae bacterium]
MNEKISLQSSLIDVDDSVLIVIDFQESFLEKFPVEERELLVNRIGWLVSVAARVNVPLVVMAEDLPRLGGIAPQVAERLPTGIHVHNKMIFGLADNPEIIAAVKGTGRKMAVLVGLETDVCVAHSALGLIQNGFQVVAVADATGSPGSAHEVGLERMRRAGVLISSVKSVYYEWLRTVERSSEFREKYFKEIGRPKGIEL